jgi:hypothetical protein
MATRTQAEPDYASSRPPPWTRPGYVASAVLLILLVLVGVCAWSSRGEDPADTTDVRSQPSATSSTVDGKRGPAGGPTAIPTSPPQVRWELFGQVALPYSDTAGPTRVTQATAAGFAHTPIGALLAAAHIATRAGSSAGKSAWQPTVTEQMLPGKDRDALLAGLALESPLPGEPGELAQLIGFRYVTYTGDTAIVGLVWRGGPGVFVVSTMTMQWQNEDWRMVAPPSGNWQNLSQRAMDLNGIVQWGAR